MPQSVGLTQNYLNSFLGRVLFSDAAAPHSDGQSFKLAAAFAVMTGRKAAEFAKAA
jgi:hypothetical protein